MIDRTGVREQLVQPEYTGDNRCLPCTVVNVALAVAIAAGLAVAATPIVGGLALGLFLLAIWLRGYLIPGTPTLTRRYLPDRVLEAFGKAPRERPTVEIESADLEAALETFADGGVVTVRDDAVRLTSEFCDRWDDRLERFRDDGADSDRRSPDASSADADDAPTESSADADDAGWQPPDADDVAAMVGTDVDQHDDTTFEIAGSKRRRWESTAALAADVAADRELQTRLEGWDSLEPDGRRELLRGLRLLRKECPTPICDGGLSRTVERLEHCCRRPRIGLESSCETCGRPIATLAVPEDSPLLEWVPEASSGAAANE